MLNQFAVKKDKLYTKTSQPKMIAHAGVITRGTMHLLKHLEIYVFVYQQKRIVLVMLSHVQKT